MEVTTDAVQVFGGAGYRRDYPAAQTVRDVKNPDQRGVNQIQRVVMSRALLR